jgi:hypothetical protein
MGTDRKTNQPTDRPTDKTSYRGAMLALKKGEIFDYFIVSLHAVHKYWEKSITMPLLQNHSLYFLSDFVL